MKRRIRTLVCVFVGFLGLGMGGCEVKSGDTAEWACKMAVSGSDVHHFINGLGIYTDAHAVMSVAASNVGLYVFYREDLVGTSDWGWKQATSLDDANNFLNRTGPYSGDPVAEATLAYKSAGELHVFYRGSSPEGSWGWKQTATVDDMHSFVNGVDGQDIARDGIFGGLSENEILTYYRVDVNGSGDWRWKVSGTVEDVCTFLNGDGDYGEPVEDARVFATSDGEFYVFYIR